ncbi:MAG: DoxX family protein [Pseudomonadota bacterium]
MARLDSLAAITAPFMRFMQHFDGVASLLLRLILGPVMLAAGWEKITGDNWFMHAQDSFPFPFNVLPADLSWFLAGWTEFLGGILLLLGLATRWIALPLMVTMFVAGYSVHLGNGWAAIAPSNPDPICISDSGVQGGPFERFVKCYNVNERTIEASKRLARAKEILREHGNYGYLNGGGAIVKLNSGIEFAATYFAMLFALFFIGGGRYLSLDYWLGRFSGRPD